MHNACKFSLDDMNERPTTFDCICFIKKKMFNIANQPRNIKLCSVMNARNVFLWMLTRKILLAMLILMLQTLAQVMMLLKLIFFRIMSYCCSFWAHVSLETSIASLKARTVDKVAFDPINTIPTGPWVIYTLFIFIAFSQNKCQ